MAGHSATWISLAGRKVKLAAGRKSQTINICSAAGTEGSYEFKIRVDSSFDAGSLEQKRFDSPEALVRYLVDEGRGKIENGPALEKPLSSAASPNIDQNSKRTRVEPVFNWLSSHADANWPMELIRLSGGLNGVPQIGRCVKVRYNEEVTVSA